jgi:hypothetical protein
MIASCRSSRWDGQTHRSLSNIARAITGTKWSQWTGMTFEKSGVVAVTGALSPIDICLEQDYGVYVEPGIWVHHALIRVEASRQPGRVSWWDNRVSSQEILGRSGLCVTSARGPVRGKRVLSSSSGDRRR